MAQFFGVEVPFVSFVDIRGDRLEPGQSLVSHEVRGETSNHFGDAHGGLLATMLDVAMASAARSLHPDSGVATVSMTLNYLRAGRGRLQATGRVRKSGRSLIFCDAEVHDAGGHLVATASGTFKTRRRDGDG